uniref:Uncharacterized protein n=1 Tax=Trichogramma kaykai TaxID=54128 RepID=A0ABD2WZD7_9HYME
MLRGKNMPELWRNGRLNECAQRRVGGLTPWIERRHGEVNCHLAQLLSSHVEKEQLHHLTNRSLEPKTVVGFMLATERQSMSSITSIVMTRLRNEERTKKR